MPCPAWECGGGSACTKSPTYGSSSTEIPMPVSLIRNALLAGLSVEERNRLFPHLQLVAMPLGKVLYESDDVLRYVYFPLDSIVSLLYVMENGESAEIAVLGNEGLIGIALFMGGETTPSRAIVRSAGTAYRLIGHRLKDEFHRRGELQLLLLRYTQALITQMSQTSSDRSCAMGPRCGLTGVAETMQISIFAHRSSDE
jgi:CRP-like cAMP-binding protein